MVFKRTEETEWTRLSKHQGPKEREEREAAQPAPEPPAAPASPSYRPSPQDVNVTVTSRPPSRPPESADEIESTIGERSFFNGSFRSESSIRISGTVEGSVESAKTVIIEETAKVSAKVTAGAVLIAGQLDGQVFCQGRVEIRPTGRVTGEITYGSLVMHDGALFEGQLRRYKEGERDGAAVRTEQPASVAASRRGSAVPAT